jgi:NadR type nicotinamide-nucleotide adenylyltransferase
MMKVVLTGSESTGKTELARALGVRYGAPVAEEFVREYARERGGRIEFTDHGPIARGQMASEDAAIARGGDIVFFDTDLVSTVVYCDHYFGQCPPWIAEEARARAKDLYLLMKPDLPWIPDGVRDRGNRREEMHLAFRRQLEAWKLPFVEVGGAGEERLRAAVAAIEAGRA